MTAEKLQEYAFPRLYPGDHVCDREDPDATILVANAPAESADEYVIDGKQTVHDFNPDYPADDDVVEVVYPQRTTAALDQLDEYAFPRSRLERVAPIHDVDDGGDGE